MTTAEEIKEVEDLSVEIVKEVTSPLGRYLANGLKLAHKTFNLYTDLDAQLQLDELREQIQAEIDRLDEEYGSSVGGVPDSEELIALRAEEQELARQKYASRLEVTVQTIAPRLLEAIEKSMKAKQKKYGWDEQRRIEVFMQHYWRNTIKQIRIAESAQTIEGPLPLDDYTEFIGGLYGTELEKFYAIAGRLTAAIQMADDKIDAGFPGGSSDPAGES